MDAKECLELLESPQAEQGREAVSTALTNLITAYVNQVSVEKKPKRAATKINVILGIIIFFCLFSGTVVGEIFGIILLALIIVLNLKEKKKVEAEISEANKAYDECNSDFEKSKQKLHEIIPFLHVDYCTPGAIETLETYFKSGRADTLKEALNLYENELALQKQQDMIDSLQSQLSDIQRTAQNAETASAISAIGSAANLLK